MRRASRSAAGAAVLSALSAVAAAARPAGGEVDFLKAAVDFAECMVEHGRDRYGRALGYIEVRGRDLGLALVRAGWADVYVYGGVPFRRASKYRAAQAQAKSRSRGVFASCQGDFHSEQ